MGKRPTIKMIAERAGVSRGTVDRVLNNRSYVKPEARQRILDAIAELGYMTPREAHRKVLEGDEGKDEKSTITWLGVLLPNWTDVFRTGIREGIEKAREELGQYNVHVRVEEYMSDDPNEVIDMLNDLVECGTQGIAICAVNHTSIEREVAALAEKGIPIVTFNSDLPNSKRISFVGQDYIKSGQIAADTVSKCVPRDGLILAMCGNREFDGDSKRLDGFMERMQELGFSADQIKIIETYNNYHVTRRKVAETLERTPELDAIYMANQSITGCIKALETAGKAEKVRLIVHDLPKSTWDLLLNGYVDFTISQDFSRQGYLPLICLRELLQLGQHPEADLIEHTFVVSYGMK